jgi:ribonuclease Z
MYTNYDILVNEVTGKETVFERKGYQIRSRPLRHTKPCLAYSLEEDMRPGVFVSEAVQTLIMPGGPMWSALQSGSPVRLSSGMEVRLEQVMGPQRRGRKFSFITDTTWVPGLPDFLQGSDLQVIDLPFKE